MKPLTLRSSRGPLYREKIAFGWTDIDTEILRIQYCRWLSASFRSYRKERIDAQVSADTRRTAYPLERRVARDVVIPGQGIGLFGDVPIGPQLIWRAARPFRCRFLSPRRIILGKSEHQCAYSADLGRPIELVPSLVL